MPCVVMLCWYGTISMGCVVLSITLVMVWGDDPCDGMCFGVLCCVVLWSSVVCRCCVVLRSVGMVWCNTIRCMRCGVV